MKHILILILLTIIAISCNSKSGQRVHIQDTSLYMSLAASQINDSLAANHDTILIYYPTSAERPNTYVLLYDIYADTIQSFDWTTEDNTGKTTIRFYNLQGDCIIQYGLHCNYIIKPINK